MLYFSPYSMNRMSADSFALLACEICPGLSYFRHIHANMYSIYSANLLSYINYSVTNSMNTHDVNYL